MKLNLGTEMESEFLNRISDLLDFLRKNELGMWIQNACTTFRNKLLTTNHNIPVLHPLNSCCYKCQKSAEQVVVKSTLHKSEIGFVNFSTIRSNLLILTTKHTL